MLPFNALTVGCLAAATTMLPEGLSFAFRAPSVYPKRSFQTTTVYQRRIQLSSTASPLSTTESTVDDDLFDDMAADLLVADDLDSSLEETSDDEEDDDEEKEDDGSEEGDEDYDLSFEEFVDMVCEAPVSSLGDAEVGALRQVMEGIAHTEPHHHHDHGDEHDHGHDHHDHDHGSESDSLVLVAQARLVERLFYRVADEWEAAVESKQEERAAELQPTTQDFWLVMQAWEATIRSVQDSGRGGGGKGKGNKKTNTNALPEAVKHVFTLFNDQQDLVRNGIQSAELTDDICRLVLRVCSSSRDRGMDRKVFEVFEDIKDDASVHVDAEMYASVIFSLAKSRDRQSAERSEDMLMEAVERFPPAVDKNGKSVGIGVDSFNAVLVAWAKSGLEYGPSRAEKLIVFMDKLDEEHGKLGTAKPNVQSFTSLIDAYAQRNEWEDVGNAEGVLNRLLDHYLQGEEEGQGFEPNIASWSIVISAWARLAKAKRRGSADRASRLIKRMESLHEEGRITFGPDAIAYVTCMNAFVYTKTPEAPVQAEEILNEMNEKYLDGDDSMKPSPRSIQNVIDAWMRSDNPKSVEKAELVLDRYEEFLEEACNSEETGQVSEELAYIYRSMLFGWAKRNDPVRAQPYLLSMMERGMEPDSICFDKIIEANTAANDEGSMSRTYKLFELMEKSRQDGSFMPNERVYTSFIRAMTKARVSNLAYKSNVILKRMQAFYEEGNRAIKPTVFTYNVVLNACAESPSSSDDSNPLDAFKVAVKSFNELRNTRGEEPDHVSFGNMLRCANLLPVGDQKDAFISTTFQLCCDSGFCNSYVLRDLQFSASEDQWRSLLQRPQGEADIELLPSEWSRKLKRRK